MESIGETLKKRRADRGLSLAEVHETTKIMMQNLAALEEDRFDAFPNRVYARAFLRDYSNFLGLDSNELIQRYEDEWCRPAAPLAPSRKSRLPAAGVALVVLIGAIGGGTYLASKGGDSKQTKAERPADVEKEPAAFPALPSERKPEPVEQPAAKPDAEKPAPVASPAKDAKTPESQAKPAPVKPANKPAPPAPAAKPDKVNVAMRAVDHPVWVWVKTDGKTAIQKTLQPGEQAAFVGQKTVWVRAGNSGSLDMTINGKNIGRLGPSGQPTEKTFTVTSAPIADQ